MSIPGHADLHICRQVSGRSCGRFRDLSYTSKIRFLCEAAPVYECKLGTRIEEQKKDPAAQAVRKSFDGLNQQAYLTQFTRNLWRTLQKFLWTSRVLSSWGQVLGARARFPWRRTCRKTFIFIRLRRSKSPADSTRGQPSLSGRVESCADFWEELEDIGGLGKILATTIKA